MWKVHFRSDPRLAEMLKRLKIFSSSDKKFLDRAEFKNLIMENIVLISRLGSLTFNISVKIFHHILQGFEASVDHPRFPWVHQHYRSSVRAVQDCGGRKNPKLHPPAGKVRRERGRTGEIFWWKYFIRVDPNKFGLGLCSVDGQRFSKGDSDEK